MNSMIRKTPVPCTIDGLAQIGMTRHQVMGIRYAGEEGGAGGAEGGAGGTEGGEAKGGAKGAEGGTEGGAKETVITTPPINPKTNQPYTAAETQIYIAELRNESKTQRETREAAEARATEAETRANAILRAAGFNPDGTKYEELDPARIQAQKTESDSERDNTKRENLVLRVAGATVNADKLLDSRAFNHKLSSIKVDDRDSVEALINEFIEKDDSYKVTSAAASSGGTQHTGAKKTTERKSLAEALAEQLPAGTNPRK